MDSSGRLAFSPVHRGSRAKLGDRLDVLLEVLAADARRTESHEAHLALGVLRGEERGGERRDLYRNQIIVAALSAHS